MKDAAKQEENVISLLKANYADALQQVEEKIAYLMIQEQTQSKIYQLEYQKALQSQISTILDSLNDKNYATLEEYLKDCYENGYIGVLYDLQSQGIPIIVPIDQEEVAAMVLKSADDIKISERLYKNIDRMKEAIVASVSVSISNSDSWEIVARKIADASDASYKRALTIARTEGHRVQQEATLHCQQKAKSKGADVVKQWDSTLDGITRPSHKALDGQIKEIDEPFEGDGGKAMFPGGFGTPSEDCNCRCCLLQRARSMLGGISSKMINFTDEILLFNDNTYQEFKKDYWSEENVKYMHYVTTLEKRYETKNFEKILGSMTDREYKHYKELLDNTPLYEKYPVYQKASNALLDKCVKDDTFEIHVT